MSETREPGYYWVRRKSDAPWEVVQVHPADRYGQAVDSMGWDAGACLPADAEWGPRIFPPGEPVHVAVFDDGCFEFVRPFSVLAEAEAFKDAIEACPSLRSTSVYLLPEQEASMHLDMQAYQVAKVAKALEAIR